ncbi:olfactory receptor 11A1-like [Branchiostoma floridae x Branchiostoma belcheri]
MDNNSSSDTANATARYEDPLQTTLLGRLLQLCWLVPSLVLILGLNCLFLVAILRTKKLWRPRFVLPASLCVLDIIQGSLFIPSSVVNIVMGGNSNPVWFCWTQASYFYIGSVCTLSTLTLMAWDRYQAICNAIQYQINRPLQCLCAKVATLWTFAILLATFYVIAIYRKLAVADNVSVTYPFCTLLDLSLQVDFADKRLTAISATYEIFCISAICFSYGKVYLETKGNQRRRTGNGLPRRHLADTRRYTRNLRTEMTISSQLIVLLTFLVPRYIVMSLYVSPPWEGTRLEMLITKQVSLLLYMTVPCFSNPVIYGLNSKDVQNAVMNICGSNLNHWAIRKKNVYEVSRSRASSKNGEAIGNRVRIEKVCHPQITTLSITKRTDQK